MKKIKYDKGINFCAMLSMVVFLFLPQITFAANTNLPNNLYKDIDLVAVSNNLNCSVVFYTPSNETFEIFNKNMAFIRKAPQSTFKIISTLMGLEHGVIIDEKSRMQYNGTKYWLDAWNKNVDLKEAFQSSCVWYYHQLVYGISKDNVRHFLQKLQYGNQDISQWKGSGSSDKDELNGFWLSSSLKISPLEQVQVLSNIFEGKVLIDRNHIRILKNIMQQKIFGKEVYAKTGSNMKGESWFVGFFSIPTGRKYFAFYVDDPKGGVSGAKDVALRFFESNKFQ